MIGRLEREVEWVGAAWHGVHAWSLVVCVPVYVPMECMECLHGRMLYVCLSIGQWSAWNKKLIKLLLVLLMLVHHQKYQYLLLSRSRTAL